MWTACLPWRKKMPSPHNTGATGGANDGAVFLRCGSVDVALGWQLRYSHSPGKVIDTKGLDDLSKIVEMLVPTGCDQYRLPEVGQRCSRFDEPWATAPSRILCCERRTIEKLFLVRARGPPATTERRNDRATDIGEFSVGEWGALCAGVQGAEAGY